MYIIIGYACASFFSCSPLLFRFLCSGSKQSENVSAHAYYTGNAAFAGVELRQLPLVLLLK